MLDAKGHLEEVPVGAILDSRLGKVWMLFVNLDNFREKGRIAPLWYRDFFVQHREDASRLLVEEVKRRLVVLECRLGHLDALRSVHLLLQTEDVLVEVKLELLIAIVDAKLLEGVVFERLETKDVKDADQRRKAGAGVKGSVDLGDCPLEQTACVVFIERRTIGDDDSP